MPFIDHTPPNPQSRCLHPEHEPPSCIVLEPGTYKYQCPGCGKITIINVSTTTWCTAINRKHAY